MLSYFGLGHLNFLTFIIVLTALTIASVTDIKSKTIPILLFPLTMCVNCILVFPTWERLIGFFILGLAFFLFASFGNGGGGDVFMMATIGLQMGISKVAQPPKKRKKAKLKQFPFAPFALLGYIATYVLAGFHCI